MKISAHYQNLIDPAGVNFMSNENLDIVLNSAQTKSALSARVSSLALASEVIAPPGTYTRPPATEHTTWIEE